MIFKTSQKWRSFLCCTAIGFMRLSARRLVVAALGVSVHLFLMSACRSDAAMKSSIVWIDNYSEAIAQALTTKKPLFLEFRCVP